jgi:ribosomal protein S18 acetylase RimI-like enzyme
MIEIRTATKDDFPAIVRLIGELAEAGDDKSPIHERYVEEYLASTGSHVLLAEDQDGVVGLLSYSVRPDLYHAGPCCMIEELVVSSGKRSLGIGGALLEAVLEEGQAGGWIEVSVGVMPDNRGAQAFYKRHGLVDEALLLETHLH